MTLVGLLWPQRTALDKWWGIHAPHHCRLSSARLRRRRLVAEDRRLLERCGFRSRGLYVMDASRRSGHSNAYFTGIGKVKRIVLFDTLIRQMTHGEIVAVLGANSTTAVEMTALTLKSGDPSYAGTLAGIALGIPSYHILESEIVEEIDPALYERELALSAMAMDVAEVVQPLRALRDGS